jgi:hypothetical protein
MNSVKLCSLLRQQTMSYNLSIHDLAVCCCSFAVSLRTKNASCRDLGTTFRTVWYPFLLFFLPPYFLPAFLPSSFPLVPALPLRPDPQFFIFVFKCKLPTKRTSANPPRLVHIRPKGGHLIPCFLLPSYTRPFVSFLLSK